MSIMVNKTSKTLLVLIFLLVLIPAFILSYYAFGAVNQEEMIQHRLLEDSLLRELDQTNNRIGQYLEEIEEALLLSLPHDISREPALILEQWAEHPLVETPFYLDDGGAIEYPPLDDRDLTNLFHWRYLNFFSNKESIPVYKKISSEYEEVILDQGEVNLNYKDRETLPDQLTPITSVPVVESTLDNLTLTEETVLEEVLVESSSPNYLPEETLSNIDQEETLEDRADFGVIPAQVPTFDEAYLEQEGSFSFGRSSQAKLALSDDENQYESDIVEEEVLKEEAPSQEISKKISTPLSSLRAQDIFETDEAVQKRVYELAEEEGQDYLVRNVLPQAIPPREEEAQTVVRSVYMESSQSFEEITQNSDYGMIPRLIDNSFILLFWARQDERIVGCEIDMRELKKQLTLTVRESEIDIRYLNILDSGGQPLISQDISVEQWRRPFVAKEISEFLPYWETAILLKSPEEFQRQIESSKYILSLLIIVLCLFVLLGMVLLYQFSASQLRDVQQRVSFVTNVSHELKTPLTSIRLYSEMLSEGFQKDPEKVIKYSSYIASESQRLTRLINNVLDFAKLEKGTKVLNRTKINLSELAEEIFLSLKEEYESQGFDFTFTPLSEPSYVWADREALIQVLLNLLTNAHKYSDHRKKIHMEVVEQDNNIILLRIHDWGIGIHRKYKRKIFKEFFRVDSSIKSNYSGTGLGLAIARNIMKGHGGNLLFKARDKGNPTGGCTFTLIFPPISQED